jgi:hypothetical protein
MSTLVAQTISNGSVSTSSANVIRGSARAWIRYNSDAQTIVNSYNVSSVTYNTTGQFTVNFTTAFANTNYVIAGTSSPVGCIGTGRGGSDLSTTSAIIYSGFFNGSGYQGTNNAFSSVVFYA